MYNSKKNIFVFFGPGIEMTNLSKKRGKKSENSHYLYTPFCLFVCIYSALNLCILLIFNQLFL